MVEGYTLTRLTARIALTGAMLPPLSMFEGPGQPTILYRNDVFSLALAIAQFGTIPKDYSDRDRYAAFESVVQRSIGQQPIYVDLPRGNRWLQVEDRVESLSQHLGEYSIALAGSPELSFQKFIELVGRNKRIFGFASGANTLLGATALASAYQVVLGQPLLAIELATAGAAAYVVIKFGAAVGRKVEHIVGSW